MSLMRKLPCNPIIHFNHLHPGPKTVLKQSNRLEQNVLVSIFRPRRCSAVPLQTRAASAEDVSVMSLDEEPSL